MSKRGWMVYGAVLVSIILVRSFNPDPVDDSSASDNTPSDEEKLLGTWVGTSIEMLGGKARIRREDWNECYFIFSKGGKLTWRLGPIGISVPSIKGTFKINATKTPKEIDLIVSKEGGKQGIMKAIYQLDGDTLKIAYTLAGMEGDRPTAFDLKQAAIVTLKRDNGAPVGLPGKQ